MGLRLGLELELRLEPRLEPGLGLGLVQFLLQLLCELVLGADCLCQILSKFHVSSCLVQKAEPEPASCVSVLHLYLLPSATPAPHSVCLWISGRDASPVPSCSLAGLGLEIWKDDSLRWKTAGAAGDVETATAAPPVSRVSPALRATGGALAASGRRLVGHVPVRIWLLVAYLSLLHIVVMVSFTHTSEFSKLQACERLGAPGVAAISGAAMGSRVSVLPG